MGPWQWWFLYFSLLSTFLLVQSNRRVFRPPAHASMVFLRSKRANEFLFDELLQGNLERECYEERCTYEEAREVFEDIPKTNTFWNAYFDGDQCSSNPCLHEGSCTDGIGGYTCDCTDLYHGPNCEWERPGQVLSHPDGDQCSSNPCLHEGSCTDGIGGYTCDCTDLYHGPNCEWDISQCPTEGPLSCEHFCTPKVGSTYYCSCVKGYKIHSDGRSCIPAVKNPCGRVSSQKAGGQNQTNAANHICPHGRCPWQAALVNDAGEELCSGVILGPRTLLTSARCLSTMGKIPIQVDDPVTSVRIPAQRLYVHRGYKNGNPNNDLALLKLQLPFILGPSAFPICLPTKDFSENVLMRAGKEGVTRGPVKTPSTPPRLSYLPLEHCRTQLNLSQPLSNKMFCMESQNDEMERRSIIKIQNGGEGFNLTAEAVRAGEGAGGSCSLLPGTPMATVEGGTVFLTGVLLSHMLHDCGQGLVFTKMSRYLLWIQDHLDNAESEMTPQFSQYPPGP